MFTPSPHQQRIFDFIKTQKGSAVIEAVAGSGKTTTVLRALDYASGSHIFLAFNKSIAAELKHKAPGVNARTFHALTFSAVKAVKKFKDITPTKMRMLTRKRFADQTTYKTYGSFVTKLVALGKQAGIGAIAPDSFQEWYKIIEHHGLEFDTINGNYEKAIEFASKLLAESNSSDLVDFDDLLYLAIKENVRLPQYDYVFVDEAQDTNLIQREIIKKLMKPNSRLFAVGDPAQAIYGFRGADSDSIALIGEEFQCARLPLTVSYRCPKQVVAFARQWVSHIEPAPNAKEGVVEHLDEFSYQQFSAGDLVVCRNTKPLVALAYKLLKAQRPFYILGKEIGQGLRSLVESLRPESVEDLLAKLDRWEDKEVAAALKKQEEDRAEGIKDKADSVRCLLSSCNTVHDLFILIEEMFEVKENATMLSTIHKAKGLEAERVFWLNKPTEMPRWAKLPWQQQQEINLYYVAATRAKDSLFMIYED